MNEPVVIESIEGSNIVSVFPYDEDNSVVLSGVIDTTAKTLAYKKYDVVGEIVNGIVVLFGESALDPYEDTDLYPDDEDA